MIGAFSVRLPGQPPTWNSSYRIVHQAARDKFGQPVVRADGSRKTFSTLKKQQAVIDYQTAAVLLMRSAKPSWFKPGGFIYVVYDFHLSRDIDADNVMKAINDALAIVLDVNDRMFLPVARTKITGVKDPYVELGIFDAQLWKVEIEPQ